MTKLLFLIAALMIIPTSILFPMNPEEITSSQERAETPKTLFDQINKVLTLKDKETTEYFNNHVRFFTITDTNDDDLEYDFVKIKGGLSNFLEEDLMHIKDDNYLDMPAYKLEAGGRHFSIPRTILIGVKEQKYVEEFLEYERFSLSLGYYPATETRNPK